MALDREALTERSIGAAIVRTATVARFSRARLRRSNARIQARHLCSRYSCFPAFLIRISAWYVRLLRR